MEWADFIVADIEVLLYLCTFVAGLLNTKIQYESHCCRGCVSDAVQYESYRLVLYSFKFGYLLF